MASPRLKCLNSIRTVSKQGPMMRAEFSTSHISCADRPVRPSPAAYPSNNSPSSSSSRPHDRITLPPTGARRSSFDRKPEPGNSNATGRLLNLISNSVSRSQARTNAAEPSGSQDLANDKMSRELSRQITRRFQSGDVYAPHDLSWVEMSKWRVRGRPKYDAFDALDLNPLDHYRNFSMVSEYMTPMGRIKHSSETGLRPVNQRRIARTIRRAVGMGIMPSVHRHPEILMKILTKAQNSSGISRG